MKNINLVKLIMLILILTLIKKFYKLKANYKKIYIKIFIFIIINMVITKFLIFNLLKFFLGYFYLLIIYLLLILILYFYLNNIIRKNINLINYNKKYKKIRITRSTISVKFFKKDDKSIIYNICFRFDKFIYNLNILEKININSQKKNKNNIINEIF